MFLAKMMDTRENKDEGVLYKQAMIHDPSYLSNSISVSHYLLRRLSRGVFNFETKP